MYQVLARKWRPRTFSELVGQQHVSKTLANAIETGRLAHAYIFAGLRGTGKTTVARILAKCLNCEAATTVQPCGECASCVEIAGSRSMDVLEIDAASRTKVEQTRELLEMVSYAPVRDRHKILIIDEVHMLSKSSFNALLKTLEEPPPNVIFVLATTELQKVLPTIVSRCQVFEFRRVAAGELAKYLRKLCDTEKIEISDVALDRLARAGEGSVRDSLSVLERVLAFSGEKVDDEHVLRVLGSVHTGVLADLIGALAARDAGAMLRVLDGLVDEGHDLVHFWSQLIAALRDLLLMRALPDCQELLARAPEEADLLRAAGEGLSVEDLTRAFQIVAELESGLKSSSQPRFLFEATLIRLASLGAVRPIEDVLASLGGGKPTLPTAAPALQKKKAADPPPRRKAPVSPPAVPAAAPTAAPMQVPATAPAPSAGPATGSDLSTGLLAAVRQARPMIGAMLEQATGVSLRGERVAIRLPAGMDAVRRQLERKDTLKLIVSEACRLADRPVQVAFEVDAGAPEAPPPPEAPRAPRVEPPAPEAGARPPAPGAQAVLPAAPPAAPRRRARSTAPAAQQDALVEQARSEPGVRSLLDTFGAHVLDIRPSNPTRDPIEEPAPPEENA